MSGASEQNEVVWDILFVPGCNVNPNGVHVYNLSCEDILSCDAEYDEPTYYEIPVQVNADHKLSWYLDDSAYHKNYAEIVESWFLCPRCRCWADWDEGGADAAPEACASCHNAKMSAQ